MHFIIRRTGALGDVILATPVIETIAANYTGATISVETQYPDVFAGNPHVGPAQTPGTLIDLDLAYERRPNLHIVDAYQEQLSLTTPGSVIHKRQWLSLPERTSAQPYAVIHAGVSWPNRTLPVSFWTDVVARLQMPVHVIGSIRDHYIPGARDQRGLSFRDTLAFINSASLFIGIDSAPLHMAGATDTPIVGLFTCCRANLRMPYRAAPQVGLDADIPCAGCHHERPAPVTTYACPRGDNACVAAFDPIVVANAARNLLLP